MGFQGTDTYSDLVTGLHHTWDTTDRQYICAEVFTEHVIKDVNNVCDDEIDYIIVEL